MEPPSEQVFDSKELLLDSVREHALSQGYAITILRSTRQSNAYIGCDRSGTYQDRIRGDQRRQSPHTRRTNCPFKLYAKRLPGYKWQLTVQNPDHNHPPEENMLAHPAARRRTKEQLETIFHLTEIGTTPRDILAIFKRQFPNALITPRDVYNARSALRRRKLQNENENEQQQQQAPSDIIRFEEVQMPSPSHNEKLREEFDRGAYNQTVQMDHELHTRLQNAFPSVGPNLVRAMLIASQGKYGPAFEALASVATPVLNSSPPPPPPQSSDSNSNSTFTPQPQPMSHDLGVSPHNNSPPQQLVSVKRKKGPSKCSMCGVIGHTARSCENKGVV